MGKAARWFRSILGKKDQSKEQKPKQDHPLPLPPANAKRWSFGKSSRDSVEAAGASNAAIARAAEAAWLRSVETDREREQSKHAIAVAAATAAAADAAVAAAQAAVAVVRLTSKGPVLATAGRRGFSAAAAAVRIQTAFRAFLAKKALRALKALVKLQALVRGYLVRRQAAATLHSMQALIRAQAAVRAHRAAALPPPPQLQLPPLARPRYSLQDDARSEHGGAAAAYGGGSSSRRLSASVDSSSTFGYDRSPKIVEVDPGQGRPKSRSSSRLVVDAAGSSEDWSANSVSSPLPCCHHLAPAGPPRIAVRHQFPDDWCVTDKARPATAQSTPRYIASSFAPPTPARSVANSCCTPGYMSSTQSSEAKARSQSAPKQRPPDLSRKRVPLSEVVVAVESARASLTAVHHRASCGGRAAPAQEAFSFKAAVVGRMDRTLEVAGVENDRLAFLQRRW